MRIPGPPLIFDHIASVIKKQRIYRPIKWKSAQKGTKASVTETNYTSSTSLNNFSNIRLCDFQSDNITAVETRFHDERGPIKMWAHIEHASLIYRSTCSAQCKLLPMTPSELYSFFMPLLIPLFRFASHIYVKYALIHFFALHIYAKVCCLINARYVKGIISLYEFFNQLII